MLKWFLSQFEYNPFDVFERLIPPLIEAIPAAVAAHDLPKPLCCVRVNYFDTHAPCTYFELRTQSEPYRAKIIAEHERNAPYRLWAPSEEMRDGEFSVPPAEISTEADREIAKLCKRVYDHLSGERGDESVDYMVKLQQALQRLCRELNATDWSQHCEVTDDFVIAPADGSFHFAGDEDYADLANCIPQERLDLLRARGFLGPVDGDWSQLAAD